MNLSTDLRVRGQFSPRLSLPRGVSAASSGGSFAQVYSAVSQNTIGGSESAQAQSAVSQNTGGSNYESYFQTAAETYQVPVNLLKAMAKAESNFNPNAVSSCGARGIMQLMPATARSLGVTDSFDPAQNIMGGAKYLRQMLDSFGGDVSLAVAAYNAGPNAVKKYGGVPPYQETQNYVTKVLGYAGSGAPSVSAKPLNAAVPVSAGGPAKPVASPVSLAEMREKLKDSMLRVYRNGSVREAARLYVEQLLRKGDEAQEDTVSL